MALNLKERGIEKAHGPSAATAGLILRALRLG